MFQSGQNQLILGTPLYCKRLARVLWSSCYGHSVWGLIRSDALRRTGLMGCIEVDHVLLGELALLGELIEIPEVLYRQRRHPGWAIPTHRTARELLAWYDPSRANAGISLPHWERVYIEYFKGIRHVPLLAADRVLCRLHGAGGLLLAGVSTADRSGPPSMPLA